MSPCPKCGVKAEHLGIFIRRKADGSNGSLLDTASIKHRCEPCGHEWDEEATTEIHVTLVRWGIIPPWMATKMLTNAARNWAYSRICYACAGEIVGGYADPLDRLEKRKRVCLDCKRKREVEATDESTVFM